MILVMRQPAVIASRAFAGERKSTNTEFVKRVTINNVKNTRGQIREESHSQRDGRERSDQNS